MEGMGVETRTLLYSSSLASFLLPSFFFSFLQGDQIWRHLPASRLILVGDDEDDDVRVINFTAVAFRSKTPLSFPLPAKSKMGNTSMRQSSSTTMQRSQAKVVLSSRSAIICLIISINPCIFPPCKSSIHILPNLHFQRFLGLRSTVPRSLCGWRSCFIMLFLSDVFPKRASSIHGSSFDSHPPSRLRGRLRLKGTRCSLGKLFGPTHTRGVFLQIVPSISYSKVVGNSFVFSSEDKVQLLRFLQAVSALRNCGIRVEATPRFAHTDEAAKAPKVQLRSMRHVMLPRTIL